MKNRRSNSTFRILATLLLAMELLTPTFLVPASGATQHGDQASFDVVIHQSGLSFLIFEENSTEGKEENISPRSIELCFTQLFNGIQHLKDFETNGTSTQEKYDTHPPLNLKNRVFQI